MFLQIRRETLLWDSQFVINAMMLFVRSWTQYTRNFKFVLLNILWHTVIETDSAMACKMILNRSTVAWENEYTICRIRQLLTKFEGLQLTMPRETNRVADAIAKCGYMTHDMVECNNLNEVPMYIRKRLFMDKISLPYFRSKCN